jgi:type IX secretion system PorP/SprF family membrane protein
MKRKIIIVFFSLTYSLLTLAQQDLLLSQQFFSRINKNPAGTGNSNDIELFMLGRMQWIGVDNSPRTFLLNGTSYFEKAKSGVGLSVSFDQIGVGHSTTNAKAVYAFHADLNEKWVLSMGLSAGANFGYFNPDAHQLRNEEEFLSETFPQEKETKITPDFDLGFELTSLHWLIGFSCTHITNNVSTTFESGRHFYAYTRGFFTLSEHWDLAPALVYMHHNKTDVMEINVMGFYNRLIWGGITWRPDLHSAANPSMMVFTLGLEWKRVRLGYSYDLNLGKLTKLPSNTHEILLSYRLGK